MTLRPSLSQAAVCVASLVGGSACVSSQSALHARGPQAGTIALLWWVMLAVSAAVCLLVTGLVIGSLRRRRDAAGSAAGRQPVLEDSDTERKGTRWLIYGGVALPAVVLVALFVATALTLRALTPPQSTDLEIDVTARQWWWDVRYRHAGSGTTVRSANELRIPAGRKVRVTLRSTDVIHSLWVPQLAGKIDAIPGEENVFWLQADVPGVFRGQCAEFCGLQHAHMGLEVIAYAPADWVTWFVNERQPGRPPGDSLAAAGMHHFETRGCAMCHAVRGTRAGASVGPDLTHFASRRTIGAATRPNVRGQLAGWIADPHGIKPGVHMPRMNLPPDELLAIVHYLEGLR